jgi:threonine aldolase
MRQAGIVAAGALYALDNHVDRLAEDHAHAKLLAEGLAEMPGVSIDPAAVETNIVIFEVPDAARTCGVLWEQGVQLAPLDTRRIRAVTHLDVNRDGIEQALAVIRRELA